MMKHCSECRTESQLVYCINRSWTMEHLLDPETKRTPCGLKWRKGRPRKRHVWIPMAIFFQAGKKCKVCFRHAGAPKKIRRKKIKKSRTKHHLRTHNKREEER